MQSPSQPEPEHPDHDEEKQSQEIQVMLSNREKQVAQSRPNISLLHEVALVAIISSGQLLTQAALALAIAPSQYIASSFHETDPSQMSWYAAAYSLTVGTFILPSGRWGDVFGHRKIFVIGFFWFALWSLLAGVSVFSNAIFFDICRAFQGIGPALVLPNGIAILGTTWPPGRRKEMVFSIFGATAPGGYVLGAIFCSIFAEFTWWPWGYWVLAMFCVAIGAASLFIVPASKEIPCDSSKSLLSTLDIAGTIAGVCGLVLFNVAWNQGPVVGWNVPYNYVFLILGVLIAGLFVFIESRASSPLLPFPSLNRRVLLVFACIALGWSSFGIWLYYVWQLELNLRQLPPLLVSAHFIPVAISGLIAALTTGFLISRILPGAIMVAALTCFTTGLILIATVPVQQVYWLQTFFGLIIMPWGMDMSFPSALIIMSDAMPHSHQGLAASLVNTAVNYSISIGLGIAGTVQRYVTESEQDLSGPDLLLKGYRSAWYMGIGLASGGILVSLILLYDGMKERRRR